MLKSGTVLQFCRFTLADVRREVRKRGLGALPGLLVGWLAGWIIAICQHLFCAGTVEGFWQYIHTAIIVNWRGVLYVLEWTCWRGMRLTPLAVRVLSYPGNVRAWELNAEAQAIWDAAELSGQIELWIDQHYHDLYNWIGLIFALIANGRSYARAGYLFCSEAVMTLLQYLGIWPRLLPQERHGHIVQAEQRPESKAPTEVALLEQLRRTTYHDAKEALRWAQ